MHIQLQYVRKINPPTLSSWIYCYKAHCKMNSPRIQSNTEQSPTAPNLLPPVIYHPPIFIECPHLPIPQIPPLTFLHNSTTAMVPQFPQKTNNLSPLFLPLSPVPEGRPWTFPSIHMLWSSLQSHRQGNVSEVFTPKQNTARVPGRLPMVVSSLASKTERLRTDFGGAPRKPTPVDKQRKLRRRAGAHVIEVN